MHDAGHEADFDTLFLLAVETRGSCCRLMIRSHVLLSTTMTPMAVMFTRFVATSMYTEIQQTIVNTCPVLQVNSTVCQQAVQHRSQTKRLGCANYHKVLMHNVLRSGTILSTHTCHVYSFTMQVNSSLYFDCGTQYFKSWISKTCQNVDPNMPNAVTVSTTWHPAFHRLFLLTD